MSVVMTMIREGESFETRIHQLLHHLKVTKRHFRNRFVGFRAKPMRCVQGLSTGKKLAFCIQIYVHGRQSLQATNAPKNQCSNSKHSHNSERENIYNTHLPTLLATSLEFPETPLGMIRESSPGLMHHQNCLSHTSARRLQGHRCRYDP